MSIKFDSFPNLLLGKRLNGSFKVMGYLEEFEVIQTSLVSFESSPDGFHLSPDIDGGLGLA